MIILLINLIIDYSRLCSILLVVFSNRVCYTLYEHFQYLSTKKTRCLEYWKLRGYSSVVEQFVAIELVARSTRVTRFIHFYTGMITSEFSSFSTFLSFYLSLFSLAKVILLRPWLMGNLFYSPEPGDFPLLGDHEQKSKRTKVGIIVIYIL